MRGTPARLSGPMQVITTGYSRPRFRRAPPRPGLALVLALVLSAAGPASAQPAAGSRVLCASSIREISLLPQSTAVPARPEPRIVRSVLTAGEQAAPMEFEVALRMRSFAELQARVARGEIIPRAEMAAKYFPLAADYDRMTAWLQGQGFTITRPDATHLAIFARGTVNQVAAAFATTFARVNFGGSEYTSAISAPSVPTALAPALLGINGLQPHLHFRKAQILPQLTINPPYSPSQIRAAYNANGTNLDGTGQTVATIIDTFPNDSDLTAFWSRYNIPETLGNVTKIQVVSGTLPTPTGEESVDVEWSTATAPGVKVRVYAVVRLDPSYFDQAYQQAYNDLASVPSLHQIMLCFGGGENSLSQAQAASEAQWLATLASAGVTVFASSGDGGSNPDPITGHYNASAPTQVIFPAGDLSVTSVGGTSLTLDDANGGTVTSEVGWNGSGGGSSTVYNRPAWQVGTGVPAGNGRLVPDVSLSADPNLGVLIALNGSFEQGGGTSVSTPIWVGFCAMINQARANAGQGPLGLLGPSIYPLLGTTRFRDITSGSNGAYSAGAGYDEVTGIGVPNIGLLLQTLVNNSPPKITGQPSSVDVAAGQTATFSATAGGNPPPTFQWQREAAGTSTWANLSDAAPYSGSATGTLTVNPTATTMNGDAFQCVVTNVYGTATTAPPAYLVVARPFVLAAFAGQTGTSGSLDGTGTAAQFFDPADLAADAAGNVYVADTNNDTIRKITPAAAVTTFAGLAGAQGSADGTGSAARFYHPMGAAVDGAGNVYVADTGNDTIRKVSTAGAVSTVAGVAGVRGHADGSAAAALFDQPSDVTVDAAGNLFVADTGSSTIREITATGTVSTVAGLAYATGSADGTGAAARFFSPEGVTVDGSGNLYVADANNDTVRRITPAGVVTTLAGAAGASGTADGPGSAARFNHPSDLAVDATGNLFVADTDNGLIRRVDPTGFVSYAAGGQSVIANLGTTALNFPTGVAVDSAGTLYVADTNDHVILKGQAAAAPAIQVQPVSQSVTAGANVQFSVTAIGSPAPTYQWNKGGAAISGATASTFSLTSAQLTDAGSYTVTVSNVLGTATSAAATLTVNAPAPPPSGGGGGGGGGGGAMEAWFVLALAALVAARRLSWAGDAPPPSRIRMKDR